MNSFKMLTRGRQLLDKGLSQPQFLNGPNSIFNAGFFEMTYQQAYIESGKVIQRYSILKQDKLHYLQSYYPRSEEQSSKIFSDKVKRICFQFKRWNQLHHQPVLKFPLFLPAGQQEKSAGISKLFDDKAGSIL